MTTLIRHMLNHFKYTEASNEVDTWKNLTQEELKDVLYVLHSVRVCQLARVSHRKKKTLSAEDLAKRIVKKDVLMISVGCDWFMDIETGEHYELGKLFGEDLQKPTNKLYVVSESPLYYECYDVIQSKHLDPNSKFTARQLRRIYNEYFAERCRQFFDGKLQ